MDWCTVVLFVAGSALGAGVFARRPADVARPLLILGFSAVLAAIAAAAASGEWALPLIASLAVLGFAWSSLGPGAGHPAGHGAPPPPNGGAP